MSDRKLFNEWYGYDKKVIATREFTSEAHTTLQNETGLYSTNSLLKFMPVNVAESIVDLFPADSDARKYAASAWRPEADGYTTEDFLAWLKGLDPTLVASKRDLKLPWHLDQNSSSNMLDLCADFFIPNTPRSDKLFRVIEMHEFLTRGDDSQTFQNFLETDTEYAEKCRAIDLTGVCNKSPDVINIRPLLIAPPRVFKFGSRVGQRTRDLFLPLTKDQLSKVVDFWKNDILRINFAKSHTFDWVKLFIQSSLGEYKRPIVNKMPIFDIKNYFLYKIMDKWQSNRNSLQQVDASYVGAVCNEILSATFQDDGTRMISYLIQSNALDDLPPLEMIAILTACRKPTCWAEETRGKSALEIFTEHMIDGVFSPAAACKFISYIIINNKQPISVTEDFDWSLINDTYPDWSYLVVPTTKSFRYSEPIKLIESLKQISKDLNLAKGNI